MVWIVEIKEVEDILDKIKGLKEWFVKVCWWEDDVGCFIFRWGLVDFSDVD